MTTTTNSTQSSEPPWLKHARKDLGLKEVSGVAANPRIVEMFTHTTYHAKSDEVSWCAAGACTWLEEVGLESPHSAAARDFLTAECFERLDSPRVGAFVVFDRKDPSNPRAAHVGIIEDFDKTCLDVLGCNQKDSCRISQFGYGKVLGYLWPKGVK